MKICVAQTLAEKGNIKANIKNHLVWIERALSRGADLIVFPELSLTGYEPGLARDLATDSGDTRLGAFQDISDRGQITIGCGLPITTPLGTMIGMVIFQPHGPPRVYGKQLLHLDELPYFVPGGEQLLLSVRGKKVAPAICFESLQPEHAARAMGLGGEIYLASVAKSHHGIAKAVEHFPHIAKKYGVPVLMANGIGPCDGFLCGGQSAVWNAQGKLLGQQERDREGILIVDTRTDQVMGK